MSTILKGPMREKERRREEKRERKIETEVSLRTKKDLYGGLVSQSGNGNLGCIRVKADREN